MQIYCGVFCNLMPFFRQKLHFLRFFDNFTPVNIFQIMESYNDGFFLFGDDFEQCGRAEYNRYCLHLVCMSGETEFAIDGGIFTAAADSAVIIPSDKPLIVRRCSADFKCSALLIDWDFLATNIPQTDYGAIGALATMQNPVIKMHKADTERCLLNFEEIRRRLEQPYHNFRGEVLRRAVEVMILDFYDIHARNSQLEIKGVSRPMRIFQKFVLLLQDGCFKQHRDIGFYASELCITAKYLSEACLTASGQTAYYWIERFTTIEIVRLLSDTSKPLNDIADELNFSSPSYLTRYVARTLGCTPSKWRKQRTV